MAAEVCTRPWLSVSGHTLHAVDAGLVTQTAVGLAPAHDEHDLLEPAERPLARTDDFHVPAGLRSETRVHPIQIRREERSLISAGPGPDLHHGGTVIQRILRNEKVAKLISGGLAPGLQLGDLGLGHLRQLTLGFGRDLPRLAKVVEELEVAHSRLRHGFQRRVFTRQIPQQRHIRQHLGVRHPARQLLVPFSGRPQTILDGVPIRHHFPGCLVCST